MKCDIEGKGSEHPVIGDLLEPETGEVDAEFTCLPLYFRVTGSVIGEVDAAAVNVFTKEFTLTFAQSAGRQHWTHFEGGVSGEDVLIAQDSSEEKVFTGPKALSAESTQSTNKGEELELKA